MTCSGARGDLGEWSESVAECNLDSTPRTGYAIIDAHPSNPFERGDHMAAMKPRTGDGPMEAVKEGRVIIVKVPLEGGGRLVVSVNDAEARELHEVLGAVIGA